MWTLSTAAGQPFGILRVSLKIFLVMIMMMMVDDVAVDVVVVVDFFYHCHYIPLVFR